MKWMPLNCTSASAESNFVFSNSDLLKSNRKSTFEENKQAAHTPPLKLKKSRFAGSRWVLGTCQLIRLEDHLTEQLNTDLTGWQNNLTRLNQLKPSNYLRLVLACFFSAGLLFWVMNVWKRAEWHFIITFLNKIIIIWQISSCAFLNMNIW